MTREEFYAKYDDVEVTFDSYYKFIFTFVGDLPDGARLSCSYGGNHDEIYRFELSNGMRTTVGKLYPYEGTVTKDGATVDEFWDY